MFEAVKERVLSLGADSLCRADLWLWVEVREWFLTNPLKSIGYLRTDRASFSVALGRKRDCTAAVWRLVRHLAPHNSHQRYLQALIRKH